LQTYCHCQLSGDSYVTFFIEGVAFCKINLCFVVVATKSKRWWRWWQERRKER